MCHPMAITVVLALTGEMVLSLTFVPASVALFLGGTVEEKTTRVMQWTKRRYAPAMAWSVRRRRWVLGGALGLVGGSGLVAMSRGRRLTPRLSGGAAERTE